MSSDDNKTMPTIEAVLERINKLGEELKAEITNFRQSVEFRLGKFEIGLGRLEMEVVSLRTETETGFRKLDRRLDVLGIEVIDMKEKQRELERRVDDLEKKPS